MTDLTTIPAIDGYETTLAQSWDGATGLMYVNAVPDITLESGQTFYITVRAGNSEQQVAEIDAIDSGAKTLNVSNVTIEKGTGTNYGTYTHPVGSSVIISDNYEVWKDIKTAIASKANQTSLDALLGNYEFNGDDFEHTAGNWKISKVGNTMVFSDGETAPVTLKTLATGNGADQYFAISETDTTVGHFEDKVVSGTGIKQTKNNPGGDETITIEVDTDVIASKEYVLNAPGISDYEYYAGEDIDAGEFVYKEDSASFEAGSEVYDSAMTDDYINSTAANSGVRFTPNEMCLLNSFVSRGNCNGATWQIYNETTASIEATGTVSGSNPTITITLGTPLFLNKNHTYRITTSTTSSGYYFMTQVATYNTMSLVNVVGGYLKGSTSTQGTFIHALNLETPNTFFQNISDVAANTRVSTPIFGAGVAGNTVDINAHYVGTPTEDLGFRIETDDGSGNPSGTLADANAYGTIAYGSIGTVNEETTITLNGSITLTAGTKYHIVFFQGTYGSETVDSSNYYLLGYIDSQNTTTRGMMLYNASRGSADGDKFIVVSSDLLLDPVLSLADATYSYKIDWMGVSQTDTTIGNKPTILLEGKDSNQSGMTYGETMYLADTPGAIQNSAGTNSSIVGRAISSAKILLQNTFNR